MKNLEHIRRLLGRGGRKKVRDTLVRIATVLAATIFVAASPRGFFLLAPSQHAGVSPVFPSAEAADGNKEFPKRLIIPRLAIDTDVQAVGIASDGAMAVPNNFSDAGWYRYGAAPGSLGSAVLTGHLDNGLGLPAVFYELRELRPGDEVFVVMQDGEELRFIVSDTEMYPYDEAPTELIFGRADAVRLNLITCSGRWLSSLRTYDHRLVVYAELAEGEDGILF